MGKSIPPERNNVVLRDDEKHLTALTTKKDTLSQHMRTLSKTGQGRQARVVQDAYLQSSVEEARQVWTVEKRNAYDRERDLHVILGLDSQFTAAVLTAKQRFIQRKLQDLSVVFFMASRHADSAEERVIFEGRWKFVSNLGQEIMRLTDGQLKGLSRSSAGGMNEIEMRESIVMDVWDREFNYEIEIEIDRTFSQKLLVSFISSRLTCHNAFEVRPSPSDLAPIQARSHSLFNQLTLLIAWSITKVPKTFSTRQQQFHTSSKLQATPYSYGFAGFRYKIAAMVPVNTPIKDEWKFTCCHVLKQDDPTAPPPGYNFTVTPMTVAENCVYCKEFKPIEDCTKSKPSQCTNRRSTDSRILNHCGALWAEAIKKIAMHDYGNIVEHGHPSSLTTALGLKFDIALAKTKLLQKADLYLVDRVRAPGYEGPVDVTKLEARCLQWNEYVAKITESRGQSLGVGTWEMVVSAEKDLESHWDKVVELMNTE
ncbi:hypothetical protein IFR04_001726 [Cadophora malorum]|uniref:Uncharacterized protein n=1 Tax=Cadophora malorum TaxID=108018 RepID=A0A8H7WHT7_9HELO|nr:hypothetical protein IFR04_001726 [Cadophora malorum]